MALHSRRRGKRAPCFGVPVALLYMLAAASALHFAVWVPVWLCAGAFLVAMSILPRGSWHSAACAWLYERGPSAWYTGSIYAITFNESLEMPTVPS